MTTNSPLIELPNGDWINPAAIIDIRYIPKNAIYGERVVISSLSGGSYITEFGVDTDAAIAFRREIATKVNNARKGCCWKT